MIDIIVRVLGYVTLLCLLSLTVFFTVGMILMKACDNKILPFFYCGELTGMLNIIQTSLAIAILFIAVLIGLLIRKSLKRIKFV